MPHNWGSAEFIRLTRNLLVLERGGAVELLAGLPDEWLPTEGNPLELAETPTRHGAFSLCMTREADAYRIAVSRQWGCVREREVLLHWSGTVEGDGITAVGDGVWRLDVSRDRFSLTLRR